MDLGSRQQRAMLALLLLREGRPLPVDEAARELWGDDVPRGAAGTIRTYAYRLRRILGGGGPGPITSSGGGYVLAVDPLAVDVGRFRHHLHKAREALRSGDASSAAAGLRAGLALWQGTPLSGAVGPGSDPKARATFKATGKRMPPARAVFDGVIGAMTRSAQTSA